MFHARRRWSLNPVINAEQLARLLSEYTWTLCTGFYVLDKPEYLFLNDSTSENAAQEWAVLKQLGPGRSLQIESITFSWSSPERALAYVKSALAGEMDSNDFARPVTPRLDHEGRCHLCA